MIKNSPLPRAHRHVVILIGLLSVLLCLAPTNPAQAAQTTITFTKHNDNIANPERGFYHHHRCDQPTQHRLNVDTLTRYRTEQQQTLILCIFYLREYLHTDISKSSLDFFNAQAATVRAAGLKMIVRFAYTDDQPVLNPAGQPENDADLPTVRRHLTQLQPFFQTNQAVIAAVQMGFIGKWGEGAYSTHFGNEPAGLTEQQWADRTTVATALLAAVPANRMIQIRTPLKKQKVTGTTTALTSAAAYRNTTTARIGHHNDCFLSNPGDAGTYRLPRTADYSYLQQETQFLPMGGETCFDKHNPDEPRQRCTSSQPGVITAAQQELRELHFSYLNADYDHRVNDQWGDPKDPDNPAVCIDDITRNLGYRFALENATLPTTATRGGTLPITVRITNSGYATPYNEHLTYLALRHTTTGQTVRIRINSDVRRWTAGQTTTISQTLIVPTTLPSGRYTAAIQVSDAASALSTVPAYSIQFANLGTWDAQAGANTLNAALTVT